MPIKFASWKNSKSREYLVNTFNIDSSYSFPIHSHDNHWEFVYCEKGSFEHQINGKTLQHSEGDMIFIRENDLHSLKGRNFKYHNIAFSGAWIDSVKFFLGNDLLEKTLLTPKTVPCVSLSLKEKETIKHRITSLFCDTRGDVQILEFSHFLLYVFDLFIVNKMEDKDYQDLPKWLQELLHFMNDRDQAIPSLNLVVERSCKCAEHISRSFRKYLGMTPSEYLKGLRLKRAAELLSSTNFSIKEVCFQSSYENPNYFNKQFREFYNQTPSEYRKTHSRIIH